MIGTPRNAQYRLDVDGGEFSLEPRYQSTWASLRKRIVVTMEAPEPDDLLSRSLYSTSGVIG
ncbi:MAG: hypothetical protein ACYCWN_03120 [Ferrimicrobium sp.]|uniref:hypothetical protein n=1 Tax=Ferrimicrobium sp. TaxID=2926050 RepID=UPI00262758FD|nr:hypothetical protein [Ferrimicrobium sp.]